MVDLLCRILREGVLQGEHAPALMISDSRYSYGGPLIFNFFLQSLQSNISLERAKAKGLVIVAVDCHPKFYTTEKGDNATVANNWLQVVDCFTDPLGWNKSLLNAHDDFNSESSRTPVESSQKVITVCRDVKKITCLMSAIISAGQRTTGTQKQGRFAVAIDSVSTLMRHLSVQSVAHLIHSLRAHENVSSLMWFLHSDLHDSRDLAALEYMSSMVATLDELPLSPVDLWNLKGDIEKWTSLEENLRQGKLRIRTRRRSGRVQENVEHFLLDNMSVKFIGKPQAKQPINNSNLPQAVFNLQLTEKEKEDRAKVVLPYEHQGNGREIHIYDGRRGKGAIYDKNVSKTVLDFDDQDASKKHVKGEIHYLRDSDDEMPDSDEDPDDDLDI